MEGKNKSIVSKESQDEAKIVEKTMVVKELPMEPVRSFEENGVKYNLITVEEALTRFVN